MKTSDRICAVCENDREWHAIHNVPISPLPKEAPPSRCTFLGKEMPCYEARARAAYSDRRETIAALPSPRPNSLPEDDAKRAQYPMADGLIDYFPNALAEVARVSFIGSQKHNKGEPMHWARDKSTDHRNKIGRHLVDAGGVDVVMVDGKEERVRHSAYLAWRALANLQEELEREEGYPASRASRFG